MTKFSSSAEKNNDGNEGVQRLISRRELLRSVMVSVATYSLGLAANEAEHAYASPQDELDSLIETFEESHGKLPLWLDVTTATTVFAAFFTHVIVKGAIQGVELGPSSAIQVNSAAFARIAALRFLGGEVGKCHAAEDLHEIEHGLLPLPFLVALSDVTTTAVNVDVDEIFKGGSMEDEVTLDYSNPKRPEGDREAWQVYLEQVELDLTAKVAQVAAITSVLAPLGTTYISSALANQLKEDVILILYEQSLALFHLQAFQEGDEFDEREAQGLAMERANELMNGSRGFSKLMFALAANTNGSWGIGDPPEIYFAVNHWEDKRTMKLAHGLGIANSEAYTIALNAWWLKRAGLSVKSIPTFVQAQGKVLRSLGETFFRSDLRNVSFGEGSKIAKDLAASLDKGDENGFVDIVRAIPRAKLQFSPIDYIKQKLRYLGSQFGDPIEITDENLEDLQSSTSPEDLMELISGKFDGGSKKAEKYIDEWERHLISRQSMDLAQTLEQVVKAIPDASLGDDLTDDHAYRRGESYASFSSVQDLIHNYTDLGQGAGAEALHERLQGKIDFEVVKKAVAEFTSINFGTPQQDHHVDPQNGESGPFVKLLGGLSHSAQEVLWALLTQIPSVPAISRLVKLSLPKLAGVEKNEKPTPEQLKRIVTALLPMEGGMSAFADNVAAYLFAENVLQSFFVDAFGEEVLEQDSHIFGLSVKGLIGIVTKMIAEQAGSMSQVGNGPNFSQERVSVARGDTDDEVTVKREPISMGETLVHKNAFSAAANTSLIAASILLLHRTVDKLTA